MRTPGQLVVAIHDIAPSTLAEVRYLLAALDSIGVRRRVLKVIPCWHGVDDLRADPALTRMLAEEAAAGSEIVLHGYTHRASGPAHGSWVLRTRARLFAGTAAEFATLDSAEMARRLIAGRQLLRDAGLETAGFCAPCWLAPTCLPDVLRQCGFRFYVTMASLVDLASGRRLWMPWAGYMGAGATQERLVGVGGWACLATARHWPSARYRPTVKVFLHPQGARTSAACARTLHIIAALARSRRLETYGSLLTI